MPVRVAEHDQAIERDHVYVTPADAVLQIEKGRLRIRQVADGRERTPIDSFFAALAEDQGEHAIGIVLSGAGSDGTLGIKAIKEHGGLTMAQATDHSGPRHSGMPESAIASGLVDLAVPVETMPGQLVAYAHSFEALEKEIDKGEQSEAIRKAICDILLDQTGHDFSGYKSRTFFRRIERRMQVLQIGAIEAYVDHLRQNGGEVDRLFRDLLIGVTNFFRDSKAFEALESVVMPKLFEDKGPSDTIRVWVPGCATGEEVYSLAIMLRESAEKGKSRAKLQLFATDIDEAALTVARSGRYPDTLLQGVSKERLERWFVSSPEGWSVRKEIRRMVVFGVNNLVSDAPISRLDLLLCRNVFIYFDATLQKRILSRFHYALRPNGILLLGKSELIPFAAKVFNPLDLSKRIYVRSQRNGRALVDEDRLTALVEQEDVSRAIRETRDELSAVSALHREIVSAVQLPIITTTLDGTVIAWNAAAARLWRRAEADVRGKRLASLGLPGLSGDLLVEKTSAVREGKLERATADGVMQRGDGTALALSIDVALLQPASNDAALLYVVHDVSEVRRLTDDLRTAREDREKAVEDLQTSNEELQSSNEELETTNEELQSANEELQTTNEELQSTNEELETTNEELQSTNAELDATNRELAARTDELNVLSFYQRTIIRSLSAAVIVLDPQGRITLWNLAAERLLGLTESEALGQLLWTLRIPVVGRTLVKQIRQRLGKRLAVREEDLTYERAGGKTGHASVAAIPLVDEDRLLGGVVIVEDTTRAVALAEERVRDGLRIARRAQNPTSRRPRRGAAV
jgi:two-component system CheB/CheR fusion protein